MIHASLAKMLAALSFPEFGKLLNGVIELK
jgi:hypothetical protein